MKLNPLTLFFFVFFLFISSFFNIQYWLSFGTEGYDMVFRTVLIVEVIALVIITTNFRTLSISGTIITVFLWVILISFVLLWNMNAFHFFVQALMWPLCFLATYELIKKNYIYFNYLNYFFILILLMGLYFFFLERINLRSFLGFTQQINIIFFPFLTLPWILTLNNRNIKSILFFLLFVAVLLSLKRSVILSISIIMVPYLWPYLKSSKRNRVFSFLLFVLIGLFFLFTFQKINQFAGGKMIERIESLSQDQGSGRLPIYRDVIKMQVSSSFSEWVLGHGHRAVATNSQRQISAHNDFLEVLYNYGIIAFTLYLLFWIFITKQLLRLYFTKSKFFLPYFSSWVIFFMLSMVSNLIIYPSYFVFLAIFWAAIKGLEKHELAI